MESLYFAIGFIVMVIGGGFAMLNAQLFKVSHEWSCTEFCIVICDYYFRGAMLG